MVNTRQFTSISTVESYDYRAKAAVAAALDRAESQGATVEESTAAAHAETAAFVAPYHQTME